LKRLKNSASEVQSAPEVMMSSEAKFIRSASSEARSPEAVVHQELKNSKLESLLILSKSC